MMSGSWIVGAGARGCQTQTKPLSQRASEASAERSGPGAWDTTDSCPGCFLRVYIHLALYIEISLYSGVRGVHAYTGRQVTAISSTYVQDM